MAAARYPPEAHSCYIAVLRALPQEVLTAVQDITGRLTADIPDAYVQLKRHLINRYTLSPL